MKYLGYLAVVLIGLAPALAASAETDLVSKKSPFTVGETLDRLETVLKGKDITVMARVDHGMNAEKVGMDLRPTQLLIFGKPEHGTQLMQQSQAVGLDLPLKALAWQDESGQVWLGHQPIEVIAERWGIDPASEIVTRIGKGLDALTDAALKP